MYVISCIYWRKVLSCILPSLKFLHGNRIRVAHLIDLRYLRKIGLERETRIPKISNNHKEKSSTHNHKQRAPKNVVFRVRKFFRIDCEALESKYQ